MARKTQVAGAETKLMSVMRFSMVRDGATTYVPMSKATGPEDLAKIVEFLADEPMETMAVVALNVKLTVLSITVIYRGTVDGAPVRIGDVIRPVLITPTAAALAVAHNHPSGNSSPSPDDARVTREINAACKLMDIDLVDHVIVARRADGELDYTSLRVEGIGF